MGDKLTVFSVTLHRNNHLEQGKFMRGWNVYLRRGQIGINTAFKLMLLKMQIKTPTLGTLDTPQVNNTILITRHFMSEHVTDKVRPPRPCISLWRGAQKFSSKECHSKITEPRSLSFVFERGRPPRHFRPMTMRKLDFSTWAFQGHQGNEQDAIWGKRLVASMKYQTSPWQLLWVAWVK